MYTCNGGRERGALNEQEFVTLLIWYERVRVDTHNRIALCPKKSYISGVVVILGTEAVLLCTVSVFVLEKQQYCEHNQYFEKQLLVEMLHISP